MICQECLENYIHELAVNENIFMTCQRIFAPIGELYHIGKLVCSFCVSRTIYTVEGDSREELLYKYDGEIKEEPDYIKEFITGEKGNVKLILYRRAGQPGFTAEEQRDMDMVLNLLFISCGRWRLINMVRKSSLTDALTGLVNSGGFLTHLDELLEKNELIQYNGFFINLERFSLVNKRFGAKETDAIIVRYAHAIRNSLEEGECLGRLGGDNFVALIRKENMDKFSDMLRGVTVYGVLDGKQVPVTVAAKAGALVIDENVKSSGNVINDCAMALNLAKRGKGETVVYATPQLKEKLYKDKQVAFRFEEALNKHEFLVYYQPKVCIKDYSLAGAEALARWKHHDMMICPGDFIPVYEQNGMICRLDFYVLEQVCRDIVKWDAMGLKPLRISVNFSRRHLLNPHLAEDIVNVLDRYGIDKERIEIELTETMDEEEKGLLIAFVNKIKQYQVATSIDDFGAGYSSLNLLRSFPADVLKIDKSLIDEMVDADKVVLSNIVRMASELNMEVIAEGVENVTQMEYLRSVNCNMVQGFLFDKPLPETEFEGRIRRWWYEAPEQ